MPPLRFGLVFCLVITACTHGSTYYLQHGNELFNARKFEEASLNYRKAIQKNPRFGEAFYRLGLAETRNHLPLNGVADLRRARQLMPGDDQVLVALGELTIATYTLDPRHPKDIHDEAAKLVEQLHAKNPNGFDANRLKGALALLDRKPAEAVEYLRHADGAKPGDPETELGLAQALLETGQEAQGTELARSLIGRNETYGKAYDLLSNYYRNSGKPQDAEQVLKLKVSNNPDRGEYILQLAAFYASQEPELVGPTLQRLIDRPSAFPDARLAIGNFYSSLGKPDEALRQYEEGLRANPKDTTPYRRSMIQILSAQRKWTDAYEQADLLLKEHPEDQQAKLVRASLWLNEGKPENLDRAISELRAQLAGKPADPAALHFQLGSALQRKGDRNGAQREWMVAAQKPGYVPPRVELAQMLRDDGKTEDALKLSEEVMKLTPGDVQVRLLRATCLTAAGKYDEARSELTQLSTANPKWTAPRYQLAVIDMYEKKYAEAEAAFRQLRAESPAGDYSPLLGLVNDYARQGRSADAIRLLQGELRRNPNALPASRGTRSPCAWLGCLGSRYRAVQIHGCGFSRRPWHADRDNPGLSGQGRSQGRDGFARNGESSTTGFGAGKASDGSSTGKRRTIRRGEGDVPPYPRHRRPEFRRNE